MISAAIVLAMAGCDASTGPVVPSSSTKEAEPPAASAPVEKPKDRGRPLNADEAPLGGPPTQATTP